MILIFLWFALVYTGLVAHRIYAGLRKLIGLLITLGYKEYGKMWKLEVKKPLMEKRRRARINGCLSELKVLLMEALQRDPAQTSKLEKADILEMTVHLLRSLERHRLALAAQLSPKVLQRFQAGWSECQGQVIHYANTVEGFQPEVKERLEKHLSECLEGINATREAMAGNLVLPVSNPALPAENWAASAVALFTHPSLTQPALGSKRPHAPDSPFSDEEEEEYGKKSKVWRPW